MIPSHQIPKTPLSLSWCADNAEPSGGGACGVDQSPLLALDPLETRSRPARIHSACLLPNRQDPPFFVIHGTFLPRNI